jgi:hypothetical protein
MKKVHKGLVAAVTCLALVAPIQAAQAVDDSAPFLTDFAATPTSLDLRNGNAEFTLSGRVSDSAGVDFIFFRCLNRPVASRSLGVALSFYNDYSWGFASMSLGQGGFGTGDIGRKQVVGSSLLDTTNVAFSITASIPAEFNSVDCKWSYFTSDKLGNSYSQTGSEDLGLRFRVLDNEGFQYENPLFTSSEAESSPESEAESSVKFTWAGLTLTADAIGALPGSKLTFKVGRNWYISDVYDDTAFSESFTTRAREDITVVSFVDSSGRASRVSAFTVEIQPGYTASQKNLATFSGSATGLTSQQKSQVKAAVEANPNAEKFICTGIRYYSQPMSVNIMVRKRAKAACEYAKELNPSLSTWYQNKPTQARSYAGKVLLTIKSPY